MHVAISKVLTEARSPSLDEAAFPAYSHTNPIINFIFWERIRRVMNYLEMDQPYEMVMDFGTGSGVLLPFLAKISKRVVAVDVDFSPLESMKQYFAFPTKVEYYNQIEERFNCFRPAAFDRIIALDVLEHVGDLDLTLETLCRLLKPGGRILISGPTENLLYKVGRVFAGPEYTGNYHQRNIYQIKKILSKLVRVRNIAVLYFPIPLFEIFYGQTKVGTN